MKELAVSAVGSAANAVGSAAVVPHFDRIMAHLKAFLALNADAAGDPETQVRHCKVFCQRLRESRS